MYILGTGDVPSGRISMFTILVKRTASIFTIFEKGYNSSIPFRKFGYKERHFYILCTAFTCYRRKRLKDSVNY